MGWLLLVLVKRSLPENVEAPTGSPLSEATSDGVSENAYGYKLVAKPPPPARESVSPTRIAEPLRVDTVQQAKVLVDPVKTQKPIEIAAKMVEKTPSPPAPEVLPVVRARAGEGQGDTILSIFPAKEMDFVGLGGGKECLEKGKDRVEGLDFLMREGDVVGFMIGSGKLTFT